jgi:uncharacterized protein YpmS
MKLSKELTNMELTKEALEIDSMIHKLYGVGGSSPDSYFDDNEENKYSFGTSTDGSSLEEVKEIMMNNYDNEEFRYGIPDLLIEALSIDDLEIIKEAITEYLE